MKGVAHAAAAMARVRRSLIVLALCASGAVALAADKGYLGISVKIEGEGVFWNPTLKSARIARVAPGSPAAQAGVAAGDEIVEVEGKRVAGAKGRELQPYLEREVGQPLRLVLKTASGELKPVTLVAGPKPP
jgi:C-terminal processing protease CtpA/Prc